MDKYFILLTDEDTFQFYFLLSRKSLQLSLQNKNFPSENLSRKYTTKYIPQIASPSPSTFSNQNINENIYIAKLPIKSNPAVKIPSIPFQYIEVTNINTIQEIEKEKDNKDSQIQDTLQEIETQQGTQIQKIKRRSDIKTGNLDLLPNALGFDERSQLLGSGKGTDRKTTSGKGTLYSNLGFV